MVTASSTTLKQWRRLRPGFQFKVFHSCRYNNHCTSNSNNISSRSCLLLLSHQRSLFKYELKQSSSRTEIEPYGEYKGMTSEIHIVITRLHHLSNYVFTREITVNCLPSEPTTPVSGCIKKNEIYLHYLVTTALLKRI